MNSCPHTYCLTCLSQLQQDGVFVCAVDRRTSRGFDDPDQISRGYYYELRVKCKWHRFGCDEEKMIGSEGPHERDCKFNGVMSRSCPQACGYAGPQVLADGEDHNCVHYLKNLMRAEELRHDQQIRTLNRKLEQMEENFKADNESLRSRADLFEKEAYKILDQYHDLKFGRCAGGGDA